MEYTCTHNHQSRFIDMFHGQDWPTYTWKDLFDTQLGKMLDANKQKPEDTSCPYLANANVQWGHFEIDNLPSMTFRDKELAKFELRKGDLMICEGGESGRCAVWEQDNTDIKYQKAVHRARPKDPAKIDVHFIQYYLQFLKSTGGLDDFITKTTIEHLTGEKLNQVPIIVPPKSLQNEFLEVVRQADKSKFELKRAIEAIEKVIKSLING